MIDINRSLEKFPKENRTFKTRVEFIQNIFLNPYSKSNIMTSCIQHKLKRSFESYETVIDSSINNLINKNPISVLKKIK